ncbi:PAS domain-containing protein [Pelagibius marinus]|uniref:PAS domain-containing protein n=1 Tax=Pelagibius marinus TaxID=2762760 RepID=UPI001873011C|nr:PAS domain-containing protein [Pelagibius marinus]
MAQAPSFRRHIAHPGLRELYDHWLQHSREGIGMPRDAFDPTAMPRLLKNLILSDVGDGGRAIRYRLVGTEIVAAHGFDYTGLTIEELTSGSTLAFARRLYTLVVSRAAPVYSEGNFRWAEKEFHWTKRLHLPLSRGGEAVDMVLVGQFYEAVVGEDDLLLPAEPAELAADRAAAGCRGA